MSDWVEDGATPHPTGGTSAWNGLWPASAISMLSDESTGSTVQLSSDRTGTREWWLRGVALTEAEHAEIVGRLIETGEAPDD